MRFRTIPAGRDTPDLFHPGGPKTEKETRRHRFPGAAGMCLVPADGRGASAGKNGTCYGSRMDSSRALMKGLMM